MINMHSVPILCNVLCDCKDEKDKVSAAEAAQSPKEDVPTAITDVGVVFYKNKIAKETQKSKIKDSLQNHSKAHI